MTKDLFKAPAPKQEIADPTLTRPDWTIGAPRDSGKLWLDKNENTDPQLARIVAEEAARITPDIYYTYPESRPLYRKLAAFLDIKPDNLILTAGSDGAIRSAFEAYIDPGDCVIHPAPTFAMYAVYCKMYGARTVPLDYAPSNNGPRLPAETIITAIEQEKPKLVCLANPDSPTGTVMTPGQMRDIITAAGKAGALVLVDEAYYPFYPETVLPLIREFDHLMVTRSTGKAWGMAGFRVGYAAASTEVAMLLHKVRPMYEINTLAVAVFERMLDRYDEVMASVERLNTGKEKFLNEMESLGFAVLRGEGNFLHVAFADYAERIHDALEGVVYYRRDFDEPCLKGYSRFSATTEDSFEPVIKSIKSVVAE